ncbi:MAG: CPBP family intramembrane glutamic endopeptidase [Chloroflexota bacterium]
MKKFERFTVRHPIGFGFILIVLYSLLGTLTWPVTQIYPYPEGHEWGTTLGKLIIAACFIGLVWRFGWLKRAGYQHSGGARIWMIVIPLMIYKVFLSIYVFTGAWTFKLPSLALMTAIIFRSLATSLLEESIYRGLLLPAMLQAWGNTRRGVVLSAAISGLFWGSLHLFNLLVRPFPIVFSQVMSITLVGFYYAVFVISSRSIWPAVVFHWVINTTVNLALSQNPAFEETITHWVWLSSISILPILVSLWLLKTNRSSEIEH